MKEKRSDKRRKNKIWNWWQETLEKWPVSVVLILSIVLTFLMELFNRRFSADIFTFIFTKPLVFGVNVLVVLMTLSIALLIPKRIFAVTLVSVLWLVLSISNYIVLLFRTTPLAAIDFLLMTSVSSILGVYLTVWQLVLIVVLLLVLLAGLIVLCIKSPVSKRKPLKGIVSALLSGAVLFSGASLAVNAGVISDNYGNLAQAYQDYGFSYCFGRSVFDWGIDEPEDYSESSVEEILIHIQEDSSAPVSFKPNIIIIQLESFFDVNYCEDLSFSENPVPNFTALKNQCSHGFLTVPSISAGTINTEFEVLSGMSLQYFGAGEYPYKTVLRDTACETIAYDLKNLGYSTHALHNNNGTFYDRNLVYPNLGFDSFTSIEYMENVSYNVLGWAKDQVLTGEIVKALDSTEEQDFIFTVSVQPHGKYPTEQTEALEIQVSGAQSPEEEAQWEYYVNQLHETDAFVGQLVTELSDYEEPVVLAIYGDHLPGLEIEENMLREMNLFQTEYILWSNFDMGEPVERDIYAYQLSSYVLGALGIDEGVITKLHQRYLSNPNYQESLEMLQYDVLYGEKEAYGGIERYQPVEMRMGVEDVEITRISNYGACIYVYGFEFTPFSRIFINGEEQETFYISKNALLLRDVEIEAGDEFTVAQMDGGKALSESPPLVWQG